MNRLKRPNPSVAPEDGLVKKSRRDGWHSNMYDQDEADYRSDGKVVNILAIRDGARR